MSPEEKRAHGCERGRTAHARGAALVALLLLTGCVLSPAQLREKGARDTFSSSLAPRDAAVCLTRAAEEFKYMGNARLPAHSRDGMKTGTYEVLMQDTINIGGTAFMAEVVPSANGSSVTTWVAPHFYYPDIGARLMAGCR